MGVTSLLETAGKLIELGGQAKELKDKLDDSFAKAEVRVEATEEQITLTWQGGPFTSTNTAQIKGRTSVTEATLQGTIAKQAWEWNIRVVEDDGFFIDTIDISGSVRHVWQPHESDERSTRDLQFSMIVRADNSNRRPVSGSTETFTLRLDGPDVGVSVPHPASHSDQITHEELTANITGSTNEEFGQYGFEITVQHKSDSEKDNEKNRKEKEKLNHREGEGHGSH